MLLLEIKKQSQTLSLEQSFSASKWQPRAGNPGDFFFFFFFVLKFIIPIMYFYLFEKQENSSSIIWKWTYPIIFEFQELNHYDSYKWTNLNEFHIPEDAVSFK